MLSSKPRRLFLFADKQIVSVLHKTPQKHVAVTIFALALRAWRTFTRELSRWIKKKRGLVGDFQQSSSVL